MANSIDTVVAKGTGAVKGMQPRLGGLTGVFETLAEQHGIASALLERVQKDPAKRAKLWPTIRRELVSHERAEMSEVYPALRELAETSAMADRHDEEAEELDGLIKRLDGEIDVTSTEWGSQFARLATIVVQHATEEEKDIFPVALEALGDDEARKLDDRFKAAQDRIKETL